MATMTLLEIVQSVLSSMNSDEVNDINDTIESTQVTLIAKEAFLDLSSQSEWPHLMKDGELLGLGDSTRPNYMQLPASVYRLKEIKYETTLTGDADRSFRKIKYVEPSDFIRTIDANKSGNSNVDTVTTSNSTVMFIRNDLMPTKWTTFDNDLIIFDSYDSDEDTTLQASKTKCLFYELPTWTNSNTAVPDIDERFFPAFLSEVKRRCHQYLRQQVSPVDEEMVRRGKSMLRQQARRVNLDDNRAKYGRVTPQISRREDARW